jgi:sec-independent protein translocase protein TatC
MSEEGEKANAIEHLEELRRRLLISLVGVALLTLLSYMVSDAILQFLSRPIRPFQEKLYFMTPYEAFMVKLEVSFIAGVIFAAPVIWFELWRFIAPGLYAHEKKFVVLATVFSTGCSMLGVLFAFTVAIPVALKFLLGFQSADLAPLISIRKYISFVGGLLLGFGIAFNLPVVVIGLAKLGLLRSATLSRHRRAIVVFILILAAVLTPSPDIFSQLLLAAPLWLLFEFCVGVARWFERRESRRKT